MFLPSQLIPGRNNDSKEPFLCPIGKDYVALWSDTMSLSMPSKNRSYIDDVYNRRILCIEWDTIWPYGARWMSGFRDFRISGLLGLHGLHGCTGFHAYKV